MAATILEQIKEYKLREIAERKRAVPLSALEDEARAASPVRGFKSALEKSAQAGRYGLICEIKKASPSKGLIREDFDPPLLAKAYEDGGATCLSVLTDAPSFQGADHYLSDARAVVQLPVIRKDFFFDPYQVVEARSLNADCILIIMAAVSDVQAKDLEAAARQWGLDVLVEVHNQTELGRALALSSTLIGINNRDLNTFHTSLEVTQTLSGQVPNTHHLVAESGLSTRSDLDQLAECGVNSFLIGESLMRQTDVRKATKALMTGDTN